MKNLSTAKDFLVFTFQREREREVELTPAMA
jgi:hypothetical protein